MGFIDGGQISIGGSKNKEAINLLIELEGLFPRAYLRLFAILHITKLLLYVFVLKISV